MNPKESYQLDIVASLPVSVPVTIIENKNHDTDASSNTCDKVKRRFLQQLISQQWNVSVNPPHHGKIFFAVQVSEVVLEALQKATFNSE